MSVVIREPHPHRIGACPHCGACRADGRPPYLHRPGCVDERDMQMDRWFAEQRSGDVAGPPLYCDDPTHDHVVEVLP